MAGRNYGYQYETSPRKIRPDYDIQRKKQTAKKTSKKTTTRQEANIKKRQQEVLKAQKKLCRKAKFSIFFKAVLLFAILFFILFRNSQINESFAKIQKLKSDITGLQKENDQLEINIQNSLNLNTIEQSAKELLGMQKLTNKQTNYISIPKRDYVEHRTEEVIIEEQKGFFEGFPYKKKYVD